MCVQKECRLYSGTAQDCQFPEQYSTEKQYWLSPWRYSEAIWVWVWASLLWMALMEQGKVTSEVSFSISCSFNFLLCSDCGVDGLERMKVGNAGNSRRSMCSCSRTKKKQMKKPVWCFLSLFMRCSVKEFLNSVIGITLFGNLYQCRSRNLSSKTLI